MIQLIRWENVERIDIMWVNLKLECEKFNFSDGVVWESVQSDSINENHYEITELIE
jgi:hypothetical protein